MKMADNIQIRVCSTVDELDRCVRLQREVFGLPDLEISPRRHLIVSREAGGWTLGAFVGDRLIGFVHHMAAVRNDDEIFGYSHMMAVAIEYQNQGVGARLKWAQREKALSEGRSFIKWTWEPMRARNAHFKFNRLGVIIEGYADNFYGTDYVLDPTLSDASPGIDSDRVFASWYIKSPRVFALAEGHPPPTLPTAPLHAIEIPANWATMLREDASRAKAEQVRVRVSFQSALREGLVCAGFERHETSPRYLLFERAAVM